MEKILIDYNGGTHGHFLEFVLNALDSSDDVLLNSNPFSLSDRGTCRRRIYEPWSLRFCADHFSNQYKIDQRKHDIDESKNCIRIKLKEDFSDAILALRLLLGRSDPIMDLSDCNNLHINIFNKLTNSAKFSILLPIIEKYENVTISKISPNLEQYHIRHFFVNYSFNKQNPRYSDLPFYKNKKVSHVNFIDFYSWDTFLTMITNLSKKFNLSLIGRENRLRNLHHEFIKLNPYAADQGYQKCMQILNNLNSTSPMPDLDIIEQSWLCANLKGFSGGFYYPLNDFFKTPLQLKEYILS